MPLRLGPAASVPTETLEELDRGALAALVALVLGPLIDVDGERPRPVDSRLDGIWVDALRPHGLLEPPHLGPEGLRLFLQRRYDAFFQFEAALVASLLCF